MNVELASHHLSAASSVIDSFCVDANDFSLIGVSRPSSWVINGEGCILAKENSDRLRLSVSFGGATNCIVFVGAGVHGNVSISFGSHSHDSIVWIGNYAVLNQLEVRCWQRNDFVAIGNGVTTTAKCTFISGNGAGAANPSIIVGDDCMFSYDIVLRNSDAHPMVSVGDGVQLNVPIGSILIEPHV